jgi:hypothetical protein
VTGAGRGAADAEATPAGTRRAGRHGLVSLALVLVASGYVVIRLTMSDGDGIPMKGWTTKLADSAQLKTDPELNGTADFGVPYATRFTHMARYSTKSSPVADFYAPAYGAIIVSTAAPVYRTTDANQRRQNGIWMLEDGRSPEAPADAANGLQQQFEDVPLPTGPHGERFEDFDHRPLEAGGTDKQLVVCIPQTGQMWEIWQFRWVPQRQRYEMGYAGYTPDVRQSSIALPDGWGARDVPPTRRRHHAEGRTCGGRVRSSAGGRRPRCKRRLQPPATRQDAVLARATVGADVRDDVPEGAWFRLPSDFAIDATKPKLWQMIVTAARHYGIVVVDGTGGSLTFSAETPTVIGTPYPELMAPAFPDPEAPINPYYGPATVLFNFPWDDLVQIAYRP